VHTLLDDPMDLGDEAWLLPDFGPTSPSYRLIARGCSAAGYEPNIVYRINDCHMTQAMVAAGEGIAPLPRLILQPLHPGVRVKPLAADAPIRRIVAVRLPSRYMTPAVARFLQLLGEAADRLSSIPSSA
jgi:DNA-binding transcriptional LysR family regulator